MRMKQIIILLVVLHVTRSQNIIKPCSPFTTCQWQNPPFPLMESKPLHDLFQSCLSHFTAAGLSVLGTSYQPPCDADTNDDAEGVCDSNEPKMLAAEEASINYTIMGEDFLPSDKVLDVIQGSVWHVMQAGLADKSTSYPSTLIDCEAARGSYRRRMGTPHITSDYVSFSSVRFQANQLDYLLQQALAGELWVWPESEREELRSHEALAAYLAPLNDSMHHCLHSIMVPTLGTADRTMKGLMTAEYFQQHVPAHYNKRVYMRPFPVLTTASPLNPNPSVQYGDVIADRVRQASQPPSGVVNQQPEAAPQAAERAATPISAHNKADEISMAYERDGIVVIDDFLSPETLREVHQWCMESTVWHATDKPTYTGAYASDGLTHPLLRHIAHTMGKTFAFLKDEPVVQMWSYNYDSDTKQGISLHADVANINVNLWITPDDANLNPQAGGLVIYKKPLRQGITFAQAQDPSFGYAYLADSRSENVTVRYRQNRIVIFKSDLYHETDQLYFKSGHKNRRINLTFLFGYSTIKSIFEGAPAN